jgi:hypothetical protein
MGVHKVIRVAYKMEEGKAKEAEKIPKRWQVWQVHLEVNIGTLESQSAFFTTRGRDRMDR